LPRNEVGTIGRHAAKIGGAILPLYTTFSPDSDILLKREQRPPIVA
jgi:hypothetical protein